MNKKLGSIALSLFLCGGTALAQNAVSGTVVDENGEPVVGASVIIKGTRLGVVTDVDGKFVLPSVPKSGKSVTISYIGMETKEVQIKPNMKIMLSEDANSLDEVVVQVAYGSAKKSTLTGAVTQVGSEQLEKRPVSSVTAALEGSTSGVQINSTYGQPGEDASIRIRGFGTVNGNSDPLYVLDGVPYDGNISDLNPNDIESITVLKDAASCALYGNRASNGVILITSKKGKNGKMQFEFRANLGTYNRGISEYSTMNANQFMEASWMDLRNSRITAGDDAATAAAYATNNLISERLYLNIYNKADNELFDSNGKLVSDAQILDGYLDDLDWYDQTIQSGARQEYNFSGSQSSEKSDYYFSLGYLDENGYVSNSGFNRLTGRANMNFRPKKWFNTGFSINGSHQTTDFSNGDASNSYTNAFMYCRYIAPIYPVHLHNSDGTYMLDASGNKQYDPGYYTDSDGNIVFTRNQFSDRHVIWENELNENRTYRNTLASNAYFTFKLPYNFSFTVNGSLNTVNKENRYYTNATIGDGKGNNGRSMREYYRYKTYTVQEQLKWNHEFGKHSVDVLLGHENYYYNYDYTYNFKTNEVFAGKDNLSNFTSITAVEGWENNYRTESYLGRVRYVYDDKYTGEVSFRRDGSSRFSKDNRWGTFGSVGGSWMISKENFMKKYRWINSLKLRADYGLVGNDAGANYYAYMALYTSDQNANKGAYYLSQNSNNDLKWETGSSLGIGLEGRFFNRWNLSLEYFDRRNRDLLFDVYMPLSAGATSVTDAESTITQNIGTIANYGFELNTDVDIVKKKDWGLNFGFNATTLKNKITKLPEQNKDGIISDIYKIEEGKSRYEFYTYTYVGVDMMTGNSLYKANLEDYCYTETDGTIVGNASGTDITSKVTKINGEYYVNNTSYALKEYQGSAIPKVYGSYSLTGRYKDFTLSAMMTYSIGGKVYDSIYQSLMSTSTSASNMHTDLLRSWSGVPEGMTETSVNRISADAIPQINSTLSAYNNATSSRWLTDASYLVMKNISLGYKLPQTLVHRIGLDQVNLNVTCENLFTLSARQGLNPQQSFDGSQSNYLVTPRVFTFGINVKF